MIRAPKLPKKLEVIYDLVQHLIIAVGDTDPQDSCLRVVGTTQRTILFRPSHFLLPFSLLQISAIADTTANGGNRTMIAFVFDLV